MKLEAKTIEETIENTKKLLNEEQVSPALKASFELLFLLITLLMNRLELNSSNSSKPPSSDPNRKKKKRKPGKRKHGGQKGHNGTTLQKVSDPDIVKKISVDKTILPEGDYKEVGYDSRQVIDIDISRLVTEYRAQILEDAGGKRGTLHHSLKVSTVLLSMESV